MIRRSFIKAISLLSLTPFLGWNKLFNWSKIAKPITDGVREIIAIDNCETIGLHWENPIPIMDAGPPKDWTWRDFLKEAYGEPVDELTEEYLEGDWELSLTDLDKPCPDTEIENWWFEHGVDTTNRVFYYLLGMDLSDELYNQLLWYECSDSPCSSYVGVEVQDLETLQKLEDELNKLGENIRFKVIQDWDELN